MTQFFETKEAEYIAAIERELKRRETTYPKLLKKMEKNGEEINIIEARYNEMKKQNAGLNIARHIIENSNETFIEMVINESLTELNRELTMRKKYYSLFQWQYRTSKGGRGISEEIATYEMKIWKEIIEHFKNTY